MQSFPLADDETRPSDADAMTPGEPIPEPRQGAGSRISLLQPRDYDTAACSRGWMLIGLSVLLGAIPFWIFARMIGMDLHPYGVFSSAVGLILTVLMLSGIAFLLSSHGRAWMLLAIAGLSLVPYLPFRSILSIFLLPGLACLITREGMILGRRWITAGAWIAAGGMVIVQFLPWLEYLEYKTAIKIVPDYYVLDALLMLARVVLKIFLVIVFLRTSRLLYHLAGERFAPEARP